jgi:CRISPR-associated protein Csd1
MILRALTAYYNRLAEEDKNIIAQEGFEKKEIPFLIVVDRYGNFRYLKDMREKDGKRLIARKFIIPKECERAGSNAWQTANLLWDHYGYVLAWPKSDSAEHKEMATKQHGAFVAKMKRLVDSYPDDPEIVAVYKFLTEGDIGKVLLDQFWTECKKIPGCNLSFVVEGQPKLVCQNENVCAYVVSKNSNPNGEEEDGTALPEVEGTCLITGEYGLIARLHHRTPIQGSKSNAKIVSFQKNMGFDSYGKQQSFNAPISKKAEFAYTTALNHLLAKGSRQKIQVGDATTVFWAEKNNKFEKVFADIFGTPPKGEPEQDYKHLISLFRSPESGAKTELDAGTKFYVLGLSPNAARIAVRFWYSCTVGDIAENIGQHFDDLGMVKRPQEWHRIGLPWLLRSTALQEEDKNITPHLAGDTMKAILTGIPYPKTLLVSVITRIKAEQSRKDNNGRPIQNVTYTRAALIKAILVRETRYYKRNEKEVGMSLDTTNTNPGYLLGRLFAVLERVQESASPSINATIRDHFYGAASSTPVTVFPLLLKLKIYHIAKLGNKGQAVNLEKQIGEIISKFEAQDGFPAHLSLQDQGRFAVGYYHQRQDFFTKKENRTENIKRSGNDD